MKVQFDSNEFTSWDLLEYLQRTYGTQISGAPFTTVNVNGWKRLGKLPDAYGGNKILEARHYPELKNLLVFRIEGLDRNWIEEEYGSLSQFEENIKKQRKRNPRIPYRHNLVDKVFKLREKMPLEFIMEGARGNQVARDRKIFSRGHAKSATLQTPSISYH